MSPFHLHLILWKSLEGLSYNVFTEVTQFLDIGSIATLCSVSKEMHKNTQFQPVWKYHCEKTWKEQ
jgi:hypothetical protein